MMKFHKFMIMMLMSSSSFAHQPDISTSLLSTTDDGKHILQITSSLTAFEGQIDYIYSKDAYKTPEEFNDLVMKYFEKNVLFIVNQTDTLKFAKPIVMLGHETKLVVEVLNVPKEINSFYYKNTMFKDMPQNKMAVMLFSDGFPKNQFLLENDNQQTVYQELIGGNWEKIVTTDAPMNGSTFLKPTYLFFIFFIGLALTVLYFFRKDKKKMMIADMMES